MGPGAPLFRVTATDWPCLAGQVSSPGRGDDDRGAAYLFRTLNGSAWYARVRLTAEDGGLEVSRVEAALGHPPPIGVASFGGCSARCWCFQCCSCRLLLLLLLLVVAASSLLWTRFCCGRVVVQDRFGFGVAMGTDRAIITTPRFDFFTGAVYQVSGTVGRLGHRLAPSCALCVHLGLPCAVQASALSRGVTDVCRRDGLPVSCVRVVHKPYAVVGAV